MHIKQIKFLQTWFSLGGFYMDDNKKFIIPTMEVVEFASKDIITVSRTGTGDADWENDDNYEPFPLN